MKTGRPVHLAIEKIRVDAEIQARVHNDEEAVTAYAERMEAGDKFPPVITFKDRAGVHWLADGFHRLMAARRLKRSALSAQVVAGTRQEAAWYAVGANKTNGLRMTNADKERAVKRALELRPNISDRTIAEHVGVSAPTVAKHRATIKVLQSPTTRVGRDGRAINTSNIGRGKTCDDSPPSLDDSPPEISPPPPSLDDPPPSLDDPPPSLDDPPPTLQYVTDDIDPMPEVDRVGVPIPDDEIAEAFQRDHELVELCTSVSRIKSVVLQRLEFHDPLYADIVPSQFEVECNNLFRMLSHTRPYAVCPYCGGEAVNCQGCKRRGWVNKVTYTMAPSNMKKGAAAR